MPLPKFKNQIRQELAEIEHINGIFDSLTWINGGMIKEFKNNDKIDGRINIQAATNETLPEIVKGTNFPDDDNYNYVICPTNFIPAGGELVKYDRFDMVNLNKYLNKSFSLKYMNYVTHNEDLEIELKLVGIYKNSSSLIDENICFTKESTLNKIYLNQRGISENDILNNTETLDEVSFYIQIDKNKNKELVKEQLENLNYKVESISEIAYEYFDEISSNIKVMNLILNVAVFSLIFLTIIKHFYDNLKYYNLLSILGYNKNKIYLINIISNLTLIIFSTIITLILSAFMRNILNFVVYLKPFIFSKFEIIMSYNSLLYIIPLAFITSLVVSLLACLKLKIEEINIK